MNAWWRSLNTAWLIKFSFTALHKVSKNGTCCENANKRVSRVSEVSTFYKPMQNIIIHVGKRKKNNQKIVSLTLLDNKMMY